MFNFIHKKVGLHLTSPVSDSELLEIVKMYASQNPEGMIPVDIQKSVISFRSSIQNGAYVRLIKNDDEICGFIAGMQVNNLHSSEKIVQQLYYYCNLKGLIAYRAVIISHEGLVKYAEGVKAKYVLSPCSQFFKNDNLCRILKTVGWSQFGYVALWNTSHHNSPSQTTSREHSQKLKSV